MNEQERDIEIMDSVYIAPTTVEIQAVDVCDGMGQKNLSGSYIRMWIAPKDGVPATLRISKGGAENLAAELLGLLKQAE